MWKVHKKTHTDKIVCFLPLFQTIDNNNNNNNKNNTQSISTIHNNSSSNSNNGMKNRSVVHWDSDDDKPPSYHESVTHPNFIEGTYNTYIDI